MCSQSTPFCGVSWGEYDLHVETVQIVKISVVLFAAMVVASGGVRAQSIYTCVDAKGNKRTADRPIAECSDREHRLLGKDGTVKRIVPPTQTPNERAAKEAAERKEAEDRTCLDAAARDREREAKSPKTASAPLAQSASSCAPSTPALPAPKS